MLFRSLSPSRDGMIHIAKLGKYVGKRLEAVSEVLKVGDTVKVEVVSFSKQGKVDLKLVEKLSGDPIVKAEGADDFDDRPKKPRPPRRNDGRKPKGDKH